jgi:HK97 family phage prohead protease
VKTKKQGAPMPPEQEPLSDGIVRRSFAVEFKAASIDKANRSVRVVASTEALDSHGENVKQNWRLERFKKNPVVLWNHNRSSFFGGDPEDYFPIGHASDIAVGSSLEATLNFVDEKANPIAERVFQGFSQGSLRAVSVGFRPGKVTVERDAEGDVLSVILDDNELYEISVVPMGSNPEAVALSAEFNAKERAALIKRAEALTTKDTMKLTLEELTAKLAEAEAERDKFKTAASTFETQVIAEKARADGLQTKLADAERALGIANEQIAKAATKAISDDVDALIGKKLKPTQREDFIKLRTNSLELFKSVVAGLPDLKLDESTTPPDPSPTENKSTTKRAPSTLLKNAQAAGEKAASEGAN